MGPPKTGESGSREEKCCSGTDNVEQLIQDFLRNVPSTDGEENDVVFRDLSVTGAGLGIQQAPTIPSAGLQLLSTLNPVRYLTRKPSPSRTILNRFNGSVRGGEMLLVLGRPGSGCTTFLKALANMREEYKSFDGTILIGGQDAHRVKKDFPGHFVFAGEDDVHFHSLSVRNTLRFALNSRTRTNIVDRQRVIENDLNTLLKLLGLDKVSHTQVGNDYIRGVSGGERRRVTLAEAILTRSRLLCFDNPTRGLDSSTAADFVDIMRRITDSTKCATIMSLYQASQPVTELFDNVLVINSGREIYCGPVSEAKEYFTSLGFYCPPSMTLADFLTSMSGESTARTIRQDFEGTPPLTAEDFEAAFKSSKFGIASSKLVEATTTSGQKRTSKTRATKYFTPFYKQVYECTIRHYRIHFTDRSTWVSEATGTLVQALMLGTLFRNQQNTTQGLYTRASAIFFCVLIMGLQASAEFGNTFAQRPILLKHNALRFYRPSAYALGQILADIPWKVVFVLYNLPIYWMINLQRTAGHFFIWLLALYMTTMAVGVMFRSIAVFTVTPSRAMLPVGLLLTVLIVYTGFYITPPAMKVWLGWIRYLNPMYYCFGSIMLNEIAPSAYHCSAADIVPSGVGLDNPQYQSCATQGSTPGDLLVLGKSYLQSFYGLQRSNMWRNVGINTGLFVFFSICVAIGMDRFKVPAGQLSTILFSKIPKSKSQDSTDVEKAQSEMAIVDAEMNISIDSRQVLAMKGHKFSWKNLQLDVLVSGENKRLLHGISGSLKPGSLTALMGASGAGKTTLLHQLSQRGSFGVLQGDMYLDDKPLPKSIKRRTGFVHQQDIHLDTSTVREALRMSAYLRQPAEVPVMEKDEYVESVMAMLEIENISDALIGMPGSGLDLERRKRVSMGVEMAAKPDLLFLDEPTSGLDGNAAASIVRLLRKLSQAGQTVLCTIHQPSAELMNYFDGLLLLAPGGKTVYAGPLGDHCSKAIDYFAGFTSRCPPDMNPAEYFLAQSIRQEIGWPKIWDESPEHSELSEALKLETLDTHELIKDEDENTDAFAASITEQIKTTTQRAFLNYWREPTYVLAKIQLNIWMAIMNGLTFLQLSNSLTDSRNRMFSIFVSVITGPVLSLSIEPRFIILRDQFLAREKDNRLYGWPIFVLSAILVELPYTLMGGLIYWILWYFMVGFFYESSRAGYSFIMYELYSLFVTSLSQLTAAVFPNVGASHIATGFVWLMVNTFNGPLSPPPLTPKGWRWFYNVSPLYYYVEGMAANAMSGLKINCTSTETTSFLLPTNGTSASTCKEYSFEFLNSSASTGYLLNPSSTGPECLYCPYTNGDLYIQQYDFKNSNKGRNVGIFIAFILFNYVMVFCATYFIYIKKWRSRRA